MVETITSRRVRGPGSLGGCSGAARRRRHGDGRPVRRGARRGGGGARGAVGSRGCASRSRRPRRSTRQRSFPGCARPSRSSAGRSPTGGESSSPGRSPPPSTGRDSASGSSPIVSHGTLVVVALAALASGEPLVGALVLAPFGLVRGLSAARAAGVRTQRGSQDLVDRLADSPDRPRAVANAIALLTVAAAGAAPWPFGAHGGWGSLATAVLAGVFSWAAASKALEPARWRRTLDAHDLPVGRSIARSPCPGAEALVPLLVVVGMDRGPPPPGPSCCSSSSPRKRCGPGCGSGATCRAGASGGASRSSRARWWPATPGSRPSRPSRSFAHRRRRSPRHRRAGPWPASGSRPPRSSPGSPWQAGPRGRRSGGSGEARSHEPHPRTELLVDAPGGAVRRGRDRSPCWRSWRARRPRSTPGWPTRTTRGGGSTCAACASRTAAAPRSP